jgi:hypothetical protein
MGFRLVIGFIELLNNSWIFFLQITITHRLVFWVKVFNSRCLVAASNNGNFPSSGFPNCPRPQPLQLSTDWPIMATGPRYISLDAGRTGNTTSNSCSLIACVSVAAITWRLPGRCLVTDVFTEQFHSNGCLLCWLYTSGFQQTCHNTSSHCT